MYTHFVCISVLHIKTDRHDTTEILLKVALNTIKPNTILNVIVNLYLLQEIKDSWIDNIDWVRVQEREKKKTEDDDSSNDEDEQVDETQIYKELVELMKPGETITKTLRRYGGKGGSLSASQKLKLKKQKIQQKDERSEDDKKNMEKVTELADRLISNGKMDTYELSYEKLNFLINKQSESENSRTVIPEGVTDDDALDMFADNFDTKKNQNEKSVKFSEDTKTDVEVKTEHNNKSDKGLLFVLGLWFGLWCSTPLSTIFKLYCGGQFYWWWKSENPRKLLTCRESLTNFIT